jgi:hypothetical protein
MPTISRISKIALKSLVLACALTIGTVPGFAGDKYETIQAQAFGTGTELGHNIGVSIDIYGYSTPADRELLVEAFNRGQNTGLVSALRKMKAVGRVKITGALGDDCAYIEMTPTPTGRRILFATNRPILFGEAFTNSQSKSYDLTAGILEINDQDKRKSTGVLFPAAQLIVNNKGELQLDLVRNPWKLVDIIDWNGTPGLK